MFGKFKNRRSQNDDTDASMTPMVDVTFLLLIFFVVTASFQLQKALQVSKQQTDAPCPNPIESIETNVVQLEIDEFGSFQVLAPDWQVETLSKQNLISKLKDAIDHFNNHETTLLVKVHEQARLQSLVDGMDAATIAGYSQLQVTQVDGFN